MKFAEQLKQPKGGLILEPQLEQDYVLGANDPKNLGQILVEDGHWFKYLPVQEIQRVRDGDTYCCTAFSDNNVDELIYKKKYNEEINLSDMFLGIGSGNKRGIGNTMKAPAEFKRKKGFVFESEYPYSRDMTLDQFYAPIPQEIYNKALERIALFNSGYLFATGTDNDSLLSALKVSPIKIAVEGRYVRNSSGLIINSGSGYNHAVVLFDYVEDKEWWIYCSETDQYLRFDWNYKFVSPMVKFFEKKTMKYKIKGNNAVFQLDPVGKVLVPYGSGKVYKTLNSVIDYKGITEVANLTELEKVAPLADWIITESPWDKTNFINSLN